VISVLDLLAAIALTIVSINLFRKARRERNDVSV
jgi:hypothetical protein